MQMFWELSKAVRRAEEYGLRPVLDEDIGLYLDGKMVGAISEINGSYRYDASY